MTFAKSEIERPTAQSEFDVNMLHITLSGMRRQATTPDFIGVQRLVSGDTKISVPWPVNTALRGELSLMLGGALYRAVMEERVKRFNYRNGTEALSDGAEVDPYGEIGHEVADEEPNTQPRVPLVQEKTVKIYRSNSWE